MAISMDIEQLRHHLDHPQEAGRWLSSWKLDDVDRAHASLVRMAVSGIPLDLLGTICDQLAEHLPRASDADMALNNLDRFIAGARNPLSLAALFERDREALPILLQIFSTSQYLSDLLVTDSEAYDLLRMTEGQPVARNVIVDELCPEVAVITDARNAMTACAVSSDAKRSALLTATSFVDNVWKLSQDKSRISQTPFWKPPSASL